MATDNHYYYGPTATNSQQTTATNSQQTTATNSQQTTAQIEGKRKNDYGTKYPKIHHFYDEHLPKDVEVVKNRDKFVEIFKIKRRVKDDMPCDLLFHQTYFGRTWQKFEDLDHLEFYENENNQYVITTSMYTTNGKLWDSSIESLNKYGFSKCFKLWQESKSFYKIENKRKAGSKCVVCGDINC